MVNPIGDLPQDFPGSETVNIVFAGNMGKAQALDAVHDASEIVQHKTDGIEFITKSRGKPFWRYFLKNLQNKVLFDFILC